MNLRRLIVSLYFLLFLALGAGSALYFWDAYQEYDRLRGIEARQRRQLAELEAKLQEQQKTLERLRTDPVYVEKVIRERLHYAKPDEFIFRFDQ
ncbi:MAG TPA: septum formation initiator family protein [Opitutus sp.]|nr:septum formation initiator family protein [Opitutus sp.]